MKEQYIILTKDHSMRGIIPNKEQLARFEKQRNMNEYIVESTKKTKWINMMHSDGRAVDDVYGYIVFKDEQEYLMENFERYMKDFDWLILSIFNDIEPMLKLDYDEHVIVMEFIKMVVGHLRDYREQFAEDFQSMDVPMTEAKFFKMKKFIEPALGAFDY